MKNYKEEDWWTIYCQNEEIWVVFWISVAVIVGVGFLAILFKSPSLIIGGCVGVLVAFICRVIKIRNE